MVCKVPFLFGLSALEKAAVLVIHWIFRRTGRHLFLTDNDEGKPPLLKRMLEDDGDCYFMYAWHSHFLFELHDYIVIFASVTLPFLNCRSALRSFHRRVTYANVGYDRIFCILLMWLEVANWAGWVTGYYGFGSKKDSFSVGEKGSYQTKLHLFFP